MATPRAAIAAAAADAAAAAMQAAAVATRHANRRCEAATLVAAAQAARTVARSLAVAPSVAEDRDAEFALRQWLEEPVLKEKIAAGAEGRPWRLGGYDRAARNLGAHALLGEGVEALRAAVVNPQKSQRGGRRRRGGKAAFSASTAASHSASMTEEEIVHVPTIVQQEVESVGSLSGEGAFSCTTDFSVSVTEDATLPVRDARALRGLAERSARLSFVERWLQNGVTGEFYTARATCDPEE